MNAPQQQGVHFYFYFFVFMVIRSRLLSISICGNFIFSSVINLYIAEIFCRYRNLFSRFSATTVPAKLYRNNSEARKRLYKIKSIIKIYAVAADNIPINPAAATSHTKAFLLELLLSTILRPAEGISSLSGLKDKLYFNL